MFRKTLVLALLMGSFCYTSVAFGAEPNDYIVPGKSYMLEHTLSGLRQAYQVFDAGLNDQNCPQCSTDRELIFLHAVTRTAMLFIDNNDVSIDSFLELAEEFGVMVTGDYFLDFDDLIDPNDLLDVNVVFDVNGCYRIPEGAPNAVELGEAIRYVIIPEINDIIGELDSINDSPSDRFRIFFEPHQTGLENDLEVDYGEVLILKGLLIAFKSQLEGQLAYDVFVDVDEDIMHSLLYDGYCDVNDATLAALFYINDPNNPSINADFLEKYPDLLKVLPTPGHPDVNGVAILAQSKQDLIDSIDYYFEALDYIMSENIPPGTDPQEDELLYIDPNDEEVLDEINDRLITLRDSLSNDTVGTYPWETSKTYYLQNPYLATIWELTLNYNIIGLAADEAGSFIALDSGGTPSPWEVTDISIDGNEIILEMDYDVPGYWGGALFTGIVSDDGNSITSGTFEYWGPDYGTLYDLSGQLVNIEVVERQLDPNPVFGSSSRYPEPVDPRDLLPEFDDKNLPISGTFGHGLDDDSTLGGILPGMTQEEWAILFDLPVPGLRFYEQPRLAVGDSPESVVLGDVDGDGVLDIVTANADSDDVSVLLGLGDGSFHEQARSGVGNRPESVVLGDVDGDGSLDIVTANTNSDDVSVLLGLGDGSFHEQARFSVGNHPKSVALGDLNGDGILDIVTANCWSADVSVLLGLGDGSFRPQATFGVGSGPSSVALGDLNGDGALDIVTANIWSWPGTISVLLGLGDGSFGPQATFGVGSGPHSVALGELNGDGNLDIVTADSWSNTISVLLGLGDGSFKMQARFKVGDQPQSLSLGDTNGDGVLDVVTANTWGQNISVLLGVGDGGFDRPSRFDVENNPQSIALGDLNGDGILDIVAANTGPSDVAVLINRSIIFGHWPSGTKVAPVDAIRIRFPHDMNTSSFSLEEDIVSFMGPQGTIDANGYEWLNPKTLEIRFEPQSACGIYELVIGPDIIDTLGRAMDVDHDSVPGEVPDDRYVATFNLLGPKIVAHAPMDTVIGPVRSLRLNFNRDMDPNSFTLAEDIVSFTGPLGPILPRGYAWVDNQTLELGFDAQWAPGTYQTVIGPQILDLAGNPLDLDGDFTPGEVPDDQYVATFNIPVPLQIGFGETISASLDYFLEMDIYTFTADVNDIVLIRMSRASGSLGPQIQLYAADGTELAKAYSYGNAVEVSHVAAVAGTYTILACDYGGTRTGGYSIFVQRLNAPAGATSIEFGKTASASIDSAAEMDTYIFSAEANDTVLVRMSSASDSLEPQIRLCAPDGTELASAHSNGNAAEISHILPADGNYTVLACDYWGTHTSAYGIFLQRLNNPANETPINAGDTLSGSVNSVADANTYTFAATVDDIVLITMNRTSGSLDPQIRLYAPDGAKLAEAYSYGNAVEISHVLANDGEYSVLACDYGGTYTGSYNLSLNVISVEQLTLDDPCAGSISTTDWHLFSVEVEADKNLLITVEPSSATGGLELYGRYGQVLTQSDYDHVTKKKNIFGNYELLISPAESGTYYFGVYGKDVAGTMGYKITASIVNRYVSDIYPRTVSSSMKATAHVLGMGFVNGMQVKLQAASDANIPAETVVLSSLKLIVAHFDLSGSSPGLYDISVIWPDDYEKTIEGAIEVKALQEGALYVYDVNTDAGTTLTYDIIVPETHNLFITLQKINLIGYGYSWNGRLSLLHNGAEIASKSGSHDLVLHLVDPEPGPYTIKIAAYQTARGILAVWTSLPELPLGEWVVGQIYCSYGSVYYQVDVPPDQDTLNFEAEGMGHWSHFDIYYGQYGSSQHWRSPDAHRTYPRTAIEIPNPAPGTYIVEFLDSAMLYGGSAGWGRYSADQTRDVLIKADTTFILEPPPTYLPTITSISTDKGGNTGLVTVEIKGAWLDPNASVSLVRQDYNDIIAQNVYGNPSATTLTATFDLTDKETGEWNLVVTNPDGQSATAPGPFTIEEGGEPELWVEIIGREKIRVGVPTTYVIRYGNRGTADAVGVPIWIAGIPSEATIELGFDITPLRIQVGPNTVDLGQIPVCLDIDGETVIPLIVPRIPSDSTGTLQITITAPATLGQFQLRAWVAPPFYSSPLSVALIECIRDVVTTVADVTPGVDCLLALFDAASKLFAEEWVGERVFSYPEMFGRILLQCSGEFFPPAEIPELVKDIIKAFVSAKDITEECLEAFGQISDSSISVISVYSSTPEDKYGPSGFDVADTAPEERKRFVAAEQEFYYKVDFWNKEDATAPAYYVIVEDQLDSDLDWSTFRFEKIGFLRWDIELEPCQYFNLNVDMRPDMDLIVDVEGTFDPDTGKIKWTFHSLDPDTMQTPDDPMAGFLPPLNPETGYEIGWVEFGVKPREGLLTGTQIADQAFVEFDFAGDLYDHPAPKEGPWINTIDAGEPNSYVLPQPDIPSEPNFLVEWTGQDDAGGSGIAHYDIYVSTDGEQYVLWLSETNNTTAIFTGEAGHAYAFYSIARDNVGNVEKAPTQPDAIVVFNRPPAANAGPDQTVEQESYEGGEVTLDGSESTDPDSTPGTNDDIVSFDWYDGDTLLGSGEVINYTFPLGIHTVTLVVTDSYGETDVDEVTIVVQDTTSPTIHSVSASLDVLWPPNHEMVGVTVTVDAEDICDPAPVCNIVNVTSNEPIDGLGDGDTAPDWEIKGDLTVELRAERAGGGTGRVYTIHIECTDASGNTATATVEVTVPHDQGER